MPKEGERTRQRWRFDPELPDGCDLPDDQRAALSFSMLDRELEGKPSFELFCRDIERDFADAGLVCQCCAGAFVARPPICARTSAGGPR